MHIPRRASWLDEFRKEIMAFPACKYDDQVDALSQALDRAFLHRPTIRTYGVKGLGDYGRAARTQRNWRRERC